MKTPIPSLVIALTTAGACGKKAVETSAPAEQDKAPAVTTVKAGPSGGPKVALLPPHRTGDAKKGREVLRFETLGTRGSGRTMRLPQAMKTTKVHSNRCAVRCTLRKVANTGDLQGNNERTVSQVSNQRLIDSSGISIERVIASELTDFELMTAIVAGERRGLDTLYRRHAKVLLGLAMKYLRRSDAEDVLHDVFLEAWKRASTYVPSRGSVIAWLSIRIKSRVIDRNVRECRHLRLLKSAGLDLVAETERSDKSADRSAVLRALRSLNSRRASLLVAAYVDECSSAEMSQQHDIPVPTVKSRLASAKEQFRVALRRTG